MSKETLKPKSTNQTEEFETDAQKIVRRHLENENDVITDEDLRSVRVGVTPPNEGDTDSELEELIEETEGKQKDDDDATASNSSLPSALR